MTTKIDLSTIIIEKIIVHDIPKHLKGDYSNEPNYSEQESSLTSRLKLFFKDKVVQSLSSEKSLKICFDCEQESPVSWLVDEIIKSSASELVDHSKKIAKYLFETQVGLNAAGILVIIFGKINGMNTAIILKLERDKGAQLTLDQKTKSYNIQEVQDLMLTEKTKIFKVALFVFGSDFGIDFNGLIMDHQIDIREKREANTWFMKKFLGCRAYLDPKITTQQFYNYTKFFINSLDDEIEKAKYIQDLNSYVQKNEQTISPKKFADDYLLSIEQKNNYKNYLSSKNFPFSSFEKDTAQIDSQIKKFSVEFENGISIHGPKGSFQDKVKLENLSDGQHKAEIISKIQKIN